jgi:hypothetical protein
MGQQMVSKPPIKQPKVPLTPTTPHRYPTGYHNQISVTKNGKNIEKRCLYIFASISFHSAYKCIPWAKERCLAFRDATYGVPITVTPQATTTTMKEDCYQSLPPKLSTLHIIAPYGPMNGPMTPPTVFSTLRSADTNPAGHHSHSFVIKNGK